MAPPARPHPGHPRTDLAVRLRSWVWYAEVKAAINLSDDALDRRYLPDDSGSGARKRVFERIRGVGSDPSLSRADLNGDSLFARVHAEAASRDNARLTVAQENFLSPLWAQLVEPDWSGDSCAALIDHVVRQRGFYRATREDRELAGWFFQDDIAFDLCNDRDHVYSAMLTFFQSHPCADYIAAITAFLRLALMSSDFQRAGWLASALRSTVAQWTLRLGWRDEEGEHPKWRAVADLFYQLVDRRLIHGDWTHRSVPASRSQRKFVQASIEAFIATHDPPAFSHAAVPIVRPSPRTEWLTSNRERLEAASRELARAAEVEAMHASDLPAFRQPAADASLYAATVRELVGPVPERDTRYCLPVAKNRGVRMMDYAAPYLVDGNVDESIKRKVKTER